MHCENRHTADQRHRRSSLIILGMCFAAVSAIAQSPPLPYVNHGACPFEGCVYREWKAKSRIMTYLSRESPKTIFTVEPGEVVTAVTGDVITTVPGEARRRGANETVYLLTSHGEGEYTAWQGGAVGRIDISVFKQPDVPGAGYSACVRTDTCEGEVFSYPKMVWWVQIRNARGQIGWTNRPQDFDCKNAISTCR